MSSPEHMGIGKNKNLKFSHPDGFTLIELLVVISIIGIIASILLLAINPADLLKKSRDSGRKQDLKTLSDAFNSYMLQTGKLPEGKFFCCHRLSDGKTLGNADTTYYPPPNSWLKELETNGIMATAPQDPVQPNTIAGGNFYYYWKNQVWLTWNCWEYKDNRFMIIAGLENLHDPDCLKDEYGQIYSYFGITNKCLYFVQDGSPVKQLATGTLNPCPKDVCTIGICP